MDCSPPGSSVHGILQAEHWSGLSFPSPGDLPDPEMEPKSPALAGGLFTLSHLGSSHRNHSDNLFQSPDLGSAAQHQGTLDQRKGLDTVTFRKSVTHDRFPLLTFGPHTLSYLVSFVSKS